MSDNVTISRELLQDLIDFAENYTYASGYFNGKYDMDAEYARLAEQVQAALAAPEPAPPDPVTYTVMLAGNDGITRMATPHYYHSLPRDLAAVELPELIRMYSGMFHFWAVGTDGSIMGRVGAPE